MPGSCRYHSMGRGAPPARPEPTEGQEGREDQGHIAAALVLLVVIVAFFLFGQKIFVLLLGEKVIEILAAR